MSTYTVHTVHTCGDSNRDPGTCPACACIRQPSGSSYRRAREAMARRERIEAHDLIFLNRSERDIRTLIGEVHDIAFDDLAEFRQKLHAIVGICSELLSRAERIADDRGESPRDHVPPVDMSWVR